MFFCDPCANENKWPKSSFKSYGRCEICQRSTDCNDVKSSLLPIKEEIPTLRIKSLEQTCGACPAQWEGETHDGNQVDIRFRYGFLSVYVNSERLFGDQISDDLDGCITLDEVEKKTASELKIEWPWT